jgi:hypothetical protein
LQWEAVGFGAVVWPMHLLLAVWRPLSMRSVVDEDYAVVDEIVIVLVEHRCLLRLLCEFAYIEDTDILGVEGWQHLGLRGHQVCDHDRVDIQVHSSLGIVARGDQMRRNTHMHVCGHYDQQLLCCVTVRWGIEFWGVQ